MKIAPELWRELFLWFISLVTGTMAVTLLEILYELLKDNLKQHAAFTIGILIATALFTVVAYMAYSGEIPAH